MPRASAARLHSYSIHILAKVQTIIFKVHVRYNKLIPDFSHRCTKMENRIFGAGAAKDPIWHRES
jgi:hypothetical protein